ncbi:MAG: hypothetical protein WC565_02335 [Parcubacteria group bacterium]
MIVFLYGEDSFRRKRKYAAIVGEFIGKNGNLGFSEFSSDESEKFLEAAKARSIFSPRTLIGLKDVDFNLFSEDVLNRFKEILTGLAVSKDIIILVSSAETSLPDSMPFLAAPPTRTQEFDLLPKDKLVFFVLKEAIEKGINFSESDARSLIASFGGDLWSISSELDKLALAKSKEFPVSSPEPSYFELLSAIKFGRSKERKLIALEAILYKLKEDPARVFNSLAYSAPKGTSPEEWFSLMADYDVAVKSGKLDYEEALLDFVIR